MTCLLISVMFSDAEARQSLDHGTQNEARAAVSQAVAPACGSPVAEWILWRDAGFALDDDAADLMALACLMEYEDPLLRDDIGFTGLSRMLREGSAEPQKLRALRAEFLQRLDGADPDGVVHPFAVLGLAELARVDRISPYLDNAQFGTLLATATRYLRSVDDYRGYDPVAGWRHGVAHGADLMLQLSLNPRVTDDQRTQMLDAIADQVAPSHAYVFAEPQRLARPVLYIALRADFDEQEWDKRIEAMARSAAFDPDLRGAALIDQHAKRQNLRAFLLELYAAAKISADERLSVLAGAAERGLRALN